MYAFRAPPPFRPAACGAPLGSKPATGVAPVFLDDPFEPFDVEVHEVAVAADGGERRAEVVEPGQVPGLERLELLPGDPGPVVDLGRG